MPLDRLHIGNLTKEQEHRPTIPPETMPLEHLITQQSHGDLESLGHHLSQQQELTE